MGTYDEWFKKIRESGEKRREQLRISLSTEQLIELFAMAESVGSILFAPTDVDDLAAMLAGHLHSRDFHSSKIANRLGINCLKCRETMPLPEISDEQKRLNRIAQIIEIVESRCAAVDGLMPPTLKEMKQEEISEIYHLAKGV